MVAKINMQNHQSWKPNLRSLVLIALSALFGTFVVWNSPALFFFVLARLEQNRLTLSAPYASCEKFVSDAQGVRVSAHREQSRILGEGSKVFVYSVTEDKGNSWIEFMKFYPDESASTPKCENIKTLDDQHFWVWEGWLLGITHDGGKTWSIWEPRDSWSDWEGDNFHLIKDVQFDDPHTGIIFLDIEDMGQASMTIRTEDGGITWK